MKVLMKGNEALAEAAIQAGCDAFFGYPITPQNEIPEYFSLRMKQEGRVYVQAESEVAAANMLYGAGATGKRSMTSSSSPGIALKQEGISFCVGSDLPCVIVSVARCGPGLGGILPSQSDYFQATRGGGNGDYYTPVYAPSSIQELADLTQKAFDIAEIYRTPVQVLIDGALAQMMEPVEIKKTTKPDVDFSWATNGQADKRPRNKITSLALTGEVLEAMNIERFKRYEVIKEKEVMYESTVQDGDEIVIVAYGLAARIAVNAIEELKAEGIKASLIRPITVWPFPTVALQNLHGSVKNILVAELSMGQMIEDVLLSTLGKHPVHFIGRCGGSVFPAADVAEKARQIVKGGK